MSECCQDVFWDYCAQQELRLQQCKSCGELRYPPGPFCPHCLSDQFAWTPASGRGVLASAVVFRHAFRPHLVDRLPYGIALVDLVEGPRMVTAIVESELSALSAGQAVTLQFMPEADRQFIPCFRIVD